MFQVNPFLEAFVNSNHLNSLSQPKVTQTNFQHLKNTCLKLIFSEYLILRLKKSQVQNHG